LGFNHGVPWNNLSVLEFQIDRLDGHVLAEDNVKLLLTPLRPLILPLS
jgi:hypothetical protein